MIKEIQAKTLLNYVKQPDTWFGLRYGMNIYRGCQHRCIYCDSRSECYQIDGFDTDVLVKVNAPELLEQELAHKRMRGTIGTGAMNDPYMPVERKLRMTRKVLQVIEKKEFPVHIITKSDLVTRDIDLLIGIARTYASVSFTITCADDELCRQVEPFAPPTSARLRAMRALADAGLQTGVSLMPVLPFITDSEDNIRAIVEKAAEAGSSYIIPAFSVTLRDRQRTYYYEQLDRLFPGLANRYRCAYGGRYSADPTNGSRLWQVFKDACRATGLSDHIPLYTPLKLPVQAQFSW